MTWTCTLAPGLWIMSWGYWTWVVCCFGSFALSDTPPKKEAFVCLSSKQSLLFNYGSPMLPVGVWVGHR
jgi:hypothetical protein